MKKEYHCLTIEAIRCFIPPGLRRNITEKQEKVVFLKAQEDICGKAASVEARSKYMAEILRILDEQDGIPLAELADMAGGAPLSSFKSLEKRGWISIEEQEVYGFPEEQFTPEFECEVGLLREQKAAITTISKGMFQSQGVFLLMA